MKYIMFSTQIGGIKKKVPIIFPNDLVHREIASAIKGALIRHGYVECKIVSAGDLTFEIDSGKIVTSGKSDTLATVANPEDGKVIGMYDYTHGI